MGRGASQGGFRWPLANATTVLPPCVEEVGFIFFPSARLSTSAVFAYGEMEGRCLAVQCGFCEFGRSMSRLNLNF